jgi:dTDP-4-amino-4,6-dideoxygalactose transaminase
MSNPYDIVKQFEADLCEYTGARYAVTTTSCTMALLLACAYHEVEEVALPSRTYVGVPMSVLNAGGRVLFSDKAWQGMYFMGHYPIIDSARCFTSGMCVEWSSSVMTCVSFHWTKILGLGQGGAILHNDPDADVWLRRARFDGRTEGSDEPPTHRGWHAYMSPETAAHGIVKLSLLPRENADLPNDDYPDLSKMEIFK